MDEEKSILDIIYEKLKKQRVALTLDEYAKKIGSSRASLFRYRKNPTTIPKEIIEKAQALLNKPKNDSNEEPYGFMAAEDGEIYETKLTVENQLLRERIKDLEKKLDGKENKIITLNRELAVVESMLEAEKLKNLPARPSGIKRVK